MAKATVHEAVLANGLKVIGERNPANKSAGAGFFVRTGARDEAPKESGLSHFLEHMMFKGTAKRNALDISYGLGNIGAQSNAYTSEETTVYYGSVLPELFPEFQELLSDMLRPALDPSEFDMEKKVILEEIALYQDRPHYYLFENALMEYFREHPAGNSVLGTTDSVGAVSRDEMKDYFDRRYTPSNMVLIGSGNFEWDRFVADAEKYCGSWKNDEAPRTVEVYPGVEVRKDYHKKDINQSHLLLLTDGPSSQEKLRYELSLLSLIIGDGVGSKLYWALVDQGIADSAVTELDGKDGTGVFMAYASMEPDRIDEVSDIVQKILATPLDFSDTDLDRARTKYISRLVLSGELPMGRLMALGNEWTYRKRIHSLKTTIDRLKGITRADIEKALESYPLTKWSEFRLLPES